MSDQRVKTTTRSWAAEVAMAEARGTLDAPNAAGVVALEAAKPAPFYVFSNGRSFAAPKLPRG